MLLADFRVPWVCPGYQEYVLIEVLASMLPSLCSVVLVGSEHNLPLQVWLSGPS